eukprot:5579085-Prymnesium_polylepis.1
MAAPLRVTALASPVAPAGVTAVAAAISLAFVGFGVAAAGDTVKTVVKARRGADFLVTTGIFKRLRHPNYTGECFGWSASFAASIIAVASGGIGAGELRRLLPWLLSGALGWVGILGVLAGEATAGLERKQKDRYGGTPEYDAWVKGSWSGPMFSSSAA